MACTPDAVETHAPLADASDLLAIVAAHLEAGHLALSRGPEPVGRLIEEALRVLQPLAAERGQSLVGQAGEELPPVDVDRERVLQVLLNLVGNALKFSPEQGVVRVTAARQGQQVRVSVRDSGSGIAPEDLPHLFERFWQAKPTAHVGSGLGLFIAKGLVEAHGGLIWVESLPGAGAVFHFTLPAAAQTPAGGGLGAIGSTAARAPCCRVKEPMSGHSSVV